MPDHHGNDGSHHGGHQSGGGWGTQIFVGIVVTVCSTLILTWLGIDPEGWKAKIAGLFGKKTTTAPAGNTSGTATNTNNGGQAIPVPRPDDPAPTYGNGGRGSRWTGRGGGEGTVLHPPPPPPPDGNTSTITITLPNTFQPAIPAIRSPAGRWLSVVTVREGFQNAVYERWFEFNANGTMREATTRRPNPYTFREGTWSFDGVTATLRYTVGRPEYATLIWGGSGFTWALKADTDAGRAGTTWSFAPAPPTN